MTRAKDREATAAELAASHDPDALLPVWVVAALVGMRASTIDTWEAKGDFPKAIWVNPKIKRYRAGTVREWLRAKGAAEDQAASSSGATAS